MFAEMRRWSRAARRNPAFYGVAVGTLAMGIGATTAIYSVVDMALLRPLPFPEPDQLLLAWDQAGAGAQALLSIPEYLDLRAQLNSFDHFAANWGTGLDAQGICAISGGNLEREAVPCATVTYNFFAALGVRPMLGRDFQESDERFEIPQVVILSYRYWQRRFGGESNVVGRSIQVDGSTVSVIGVMPPMFDVPTRCQVWTPPPFDERRRTTARGMRYLRAIARPKAGVSLLQAQAEFDMIAKRVVMGPTGGGSWFSARLTPLQQVLVSDTRLGLLAVQVSAVILLLIACCNVANLLLTLAAARGKEMAIRAVAGASPARLAAQALGESLGLASAGGMAGTLLAYWLLRMLIVLTPVQIARLDEARIDIRVMLVTLLVCVVAGCLFGVAPAIAAASVQPREKLAEGGRGGTAAGGRLSAGLVVVEIALAMMLSVVAVLTYRSYAGLQQIEPGFEKRNALRVELVPPADQDRVSAGRALRTLVETVASRPGVEAAGIAQDLPLGGWQQDFRFRLQQERSTDPNQSRSALLHGVSFDYFRAMGIPIQRGRSFAASDQPSGSKGVAVINEELARQCFGSTDPVGRYIYSGAQGAFEIVGVVGNVRHRDLGEPPQPELYLHAYGGAMFLVVRSRMAPKVLAMEVRKAIQSTNRDVGVAGSETLEETVRRAGARQRFWMILAGGFAFLSLSMAAAGVYALVSYSVGRRVPEFGIRMALGALPADIRNTVMGQTLRRSIVGVVAGLAASLALTRALSSLLFGVKAYDPISLLGAALMVAGISLAASYVPARWAARVDPAVSLREE